MSGMGTPRITRRRSAKGMAAALMAAALTPAIIGRAKAAAMKLRLSSSLPNDPKYANGRVFNDRLVSRLEENGLKDKIEIQFFPDNQLGQEIDVINSVIGISAS